VSKIPEKPVKIPDKLFRQVWGTSGKNPSHAQKFACSYSYVQGWAKIYLQGGKSGKISFLPLETRKTTFFAKKLMGKCQISKSWGPLPSHTHAPKTFYNRKAEENSNNIFTNKHKMNFENNTD